MKTTIIVGAGASAELGLPTGGELKDLIIDSLSQQTRDRRTTFTGDKQILEAFHALSRSEPGYNRVLEYTRTAQELTNALHLAPSIDNYLHTHAQDARVQVCGKLAIASCILAAERNSKLGSKTRFAPSLDRMGDTWIGALFGLLAEAGSLDSFVSRLERIRFIVFNYDRCLEHFLHSALQVYFKCTEVEATEAMAVLDVCHPYGTVGSLSWQGSGPGVNFGGIEYWESLWNVAIQVRTFTEQVESETRDLLKRMVEDAGQLIFLGFAFHDLNIDLICPDQDNKVNRRIYASAFGISEPNSKQIVKMLDDRGFALDRNTTLETGLKAEPLIRAYSRYLGLA